MNAQIGRFVNAALHFVVLSIVVAVCAAMLSSIITTDTASMVPKLGDQGFVVTVFVSALTWWLASNASKFANEMGGKLSYDIGQNLQKDASSLWDKTKKNAKTVIEIIKKAK